MRQLGLFEHQDLKEFTKWDSGCEISGEDGTSAEKNSGCRGTSGWNGRGRNSGCDMSGCNGGGGISDAICPDGMLAEENFRMWETSGWNGGGRNSRCDGRPCGMTTEEFRMWDMSRWNECGYE